MLKINAFKLPDSKNRRMFKAKAATLKLIDLSKFSISSLVVPGDIITIDGQPVKDGDYHVVFNNTDYKLTVKDGRVVEFISISELKKKGI